MRSVILSTGYMYIGRCFLAYFSQTHAVPKPVGFVSKRGEYPLIGWLSWGKHDALNYELSVYQVVSSCSHEKMTCDVRMKFHDILHFDPIPIFTHRLHWAPLIQYIPIYVDGFPLVFPLKPPRKPYPGSDSHGPWMSLCCPPSDALQDVLDVRPIAANAIEMAMTSFSERGRKGMSGCLGENLVVKIWGSFLFFQFLRFSDKVVFCWNYMKLFSCSSWWGPWGQRSLPHSQAIPLTQNQVCEDGGFLVVKQKKLKTWPRPIKCHDVMNFAATVRCHLWGTKRCWVVPQFVS